MPGIVLPSFLVSLLELWRDPQWYFPTRVSRLPSTVNRTETSRRFADRLRDTHWAVSAGELRAPTTREVYDIRNTEEGERLGALLEHPPPKMRPSDDLEMADFRPKDDDPFSPRPHHIGGRHNHNRLRRGNDLGFGNRSYGDTVRGWVDSFRRDPGRHVTPAAAITSEDPRRRHRHGHGYGHGTGHGHHGHRHRASSSVATADASGVGVGTGVLNGLDESKPSSFSSSSAGGRAGRSRGGRGGRSHYFDLHAANVGTANTLLSRELKSRHLQMIAIGGSIGGWFISQRREWSASH